MFQPRSCRMCSWRAGSDGARVADGIVVGDAIWDHVGARRAGMLSVGVLTG